MERTAVIAARLRAVRVLELLWGFCMCLVFIPKLDCHNALSPAWPRKCLPNVLAKVINQAIKRSRDKVLGPFSSG